MGLSLYQGTASAVPLKQSSTKRDKGATVPLYYPKSRFLSFAFRRREMLRSE